MRSWPIALAFLASSTAFAGINPFAYDRAQLYDFEGSVSIEGQVEVPLYRPHVGSSQPCVEVTLPDGSVHLFDVNVAQTGVMVTAEFAEAAGAKVKEVEFKKGAGKGKVTTIATFNIGSVTFSSVNASVASAPATPGERSVGRYLPGGGIPRSGSIGIAGFTELAGALVRSEGVLRLAPASQGEVLLASLEGGNQMAYTSDDYWLHKPDKKTTHVNLPHPIVFNGNYGDTEARVSFSLHEQSVVSPSIADDLDVIRVGSKTVLSDALAVGGIDSTLVSTVETGLRLHESKIDLFIGEDDAVDWDIAWSPVNSALSLRQGESDGIGEYYEQATAKLLESLEEEETEGDEAKAESSDEGESSEEEGSNKAHAPTYANLATVSVMHGKADKALEYMNLAVEADSENCTYHVGKGLLHLWEGNNAAASESFVTAHDLYAPWAALDLETRKELSEEAKEDQPSKQASSCFRAKGLNALANSTDGDASALSDLDIGNEAFSTLPGIAVGNAHLAAGNFADAMPAFLQVARLERGQSWAGMAIAQSPQHPEKALANFEQAMWHVPNDLELARHYVETLTGAEGAEQAAAKIGAMAAKLPTNGTWHLAHGEALVAAGQDGSAAFSAAEERFQWALTFRMNAETMGQFAHAKVARGDYTTARAIANKAINSSVHSVSGLTALAAVEVNDGNLDAAKALLKRAAASGNPAHAARLAQDLVAPAPPEEEEGEE